MRWIILNSIFSNLANIFYNLIFPHRCALCDNIISNNILICSSCNKDLKFEFSKRKICIMNNKEVDCIAPFTYSNKVRESIIRFKFHSKVGNSKFLSFAMTKALENYKEKFDVLVPVPISLKRKMERKYNQCEFLAEEISKNVEIPCKNILIKIVDNPAQHNISSVYKSENVKNVYKIDSDFEIRDKKILLIDDVCTTGNTFKECAKTLLDGGAKSVTGLVIAMAKSK